MTTVHDSVLSAYAETTEGIDATLSPRVESHVLGRARARRRGRLAGVVSSAAVVVALGATAVAFGAANQAAPPANSTTPAPEVTGGPPRAERLDAMPGLVGVADIAWQLSDTGGSGIAGAPPMWALSDAVIERIGPGWAYEVLDERSCIDPDPSGDPGMLAVVSPDGYTFEVATLPRELCGAQILDVSDSGTVVTFFGVRSNEAALYSYAVPTASMSSIDFGAEAVSAQRLAGTSDDASVVALFGQDGTGMLVLASATGISPFNLGGLERFTAASAGDAAVVAPVDPEGALVFTEPWYLASAVDGTVVPLAIDAPDEALTDRHCELVSERSTVAITCLDAGAWEVGRDGSTVPWTDEPEDLSMRPAGEGVDGDAAVMRVMMPVGGTRTELLGAQDLAIPGGDPAPLSVRPYTIDGAPGLYGVTLIRDAWMGDAHQVFAGLALVRASDGATVYLAPVGGDGTPTAVREVYWVGQQRP